MRVLIDACVLYPTVMREIALGAAKAGVFEPRWSDRILEEWARAAARHGAEQETYARGEIAMLGAQFPKASIKPDLGLEQRLWLPDPNDIHVFSAAISGSCDVILTMNAKDFPRNILAEEGVSRADPDNFLLGLYEANPNTVRHVCDAVLTEAIRLSNEGWTMRKLLKKARLPRLGKALEA